MNQLRHVPRPPRRRLSEELDFQRPAEVLACGSDLLDAALADGSALRDWLEARADFEAGVAEALLQARLDFGDQPADPHRRVWLDGLHQHLGANLEELRHRLDLKASEAVGRAIPVPPGSAAWVPALQKRLALYRESNLALQERLCELELDYIQLMGNLSIRRSGRPCPLPEMRHHLLGEDPTVRRAVWESRAALLEELRPTLEDLLDEMLALREQMARNADQPTWNAHRAAWGLPPATWKPEALVAAGLGQARVQRAWDLAVCGLGGDGYRSGAGLELAELVEGLSYHAPALSITLRRLGLLHLLDIQPRSGKFDLDGCLWLPEHQLPVLRMSAHALEDDLCRLLRQLLAAHHGLAECAAGRPPAGILLSPHPAQSREVSAVIRGLLSDYDSGHAARVQRRLAFLRRLELRQALCLEYWAWWLHEHPGASRAQRRRLWTTTQALACPGLAELGSTPDLEDTLFLEPAFFLPDWSPPSLARLLLEAVD